MSLYLPIAEIALSVPLLLLLGGVIGLLSGMFGVGGGFLLTPLLIFLGVPAPVAVGTGANQVVASSVSGVLAHWRRGNVDVMMAAVLVGGGLVGAILGVWLFALLRRLGQVDLVISLSYVLLLGTLGAMMLAEGIRAYRRLRSAPGRLTKLHTHYLVHRLPLKMRFRKSRLYISALLPFGLGLVIGIMTAIMGVGGGFLLVPAMIYLIGMPTVMTVGTSLLQIAIVGSAVTFLQATTNQTVDIVLALILILGGVVGAQIGAVFAGKLRGDQIRILLGLIVLAVGLAVAVDLVLPPTDLYILTPVVG